MLRSYDLLVISLPSFTVSGAGSNKKNSVEGPMSWGLLGVLKPSLLLKSVEKEKGTSGSVTLLNSKAKKTTPLASRVFFVAF